MLGAPIDDRSHIGQGRTRLRAEQTACLHNRGSTVTFACQRALVNLAASFLALASRCLINLIGEHGGRCSID